MRKTRLLVAAMVIALSPATIQAQITTSHIATDTELIAMLSDTMFVAEGRIGDRGGAATFELDVGQLPRIGRPSRPYYRLGLVPLHARTSIVGTDHPRLLRFGKWTPQRELPDASPA